MLVLFLYPFLAQIRTKSIDYVILFTRSSNETSYIYDDKPQNGSHLLGKEWLWKREGAF